MIRSTSSGGPDAARAAIAAWRDLSPATINRRLAVLKAALPVDVAVYAGGATYVSDDYDERSGAAIEPLVPRCAMAQRTR
mgnify:CR=1 FL=1